MVANNEDTYLVIVLTIKNRETITRIFIHHGLLNSKA